MKKETSVLIVDDNRTNRIILESIFSKEGFQTYSAENGAQGREMAQTRLPDLILLDIMMPGESGFETCQTLKMDPRTSDIPIIFVTAMTDVQEKVKGFSLGAVDYVTKPFERMEILARARLHIKLKEAYSRLIEEQSAKLRQLQEAQKAILVRPEDVPAAGFAVIYKPFHEVGGDFYEVMEEGEGIFSYFVADISGHDLGSSLPTSALKALLIKNTGPLYTPDETMKMMNRIMCTVLADDQFLTACFAQLNRLRSKLTLISAGHLPVIYVDPHGGVEIIASTGDVMGVFPTVSFDVYEKPVSKGDRFYLYSDGLVEIFGEKTRSWKEGIGVLAEACRITRDRPLAEAVSEIVKTLYPEKDPPRDDLVLMGVEV
jgi:phosphoserine phosphatase RsbU/P